MSYCSYLLKEYFGVDEAVPLLPAVAVGIGTAIAGLSTVACAQDSTCRSIPGRFIKSLQRDSNMKYPTNPNSPYNPKKYQNRRSSNDVDNSSDDSHPTYDSDSE